MANTSDQLYFQAVNVGTILAKLEYYDGSTSE